MDMSKAVAIDTETGRFAPGLLAPPLVCVSFARSGDRGLLHVKDPACKRFVEDVFTHSDPIYGLNIAYDVGVLANAYPDMVPLFFEAYEDDRVLDVGLQQKLVDISQGIMRIMESRGGYSLNALGKRLLKRDRSKEKGEDSWRMRYIELIDTPVSAWESAARQYPIDDAAETLDLGLLQVKRWLPLLADAPRQTRAALALHLISCWGIHTAPERVKLLRLSAEDAFEVIGAELKKTGLVRFDGTRDVRAAQRLMVKVAREGGFRPKLTKTGYERYETLVEQHGERKAPQLLFVEKDLIKYTSVDQDACKESADETLIKYGRYIQLQGVVDTHAPDLEKGTVTPIQARYNPLVDTGRTSCSKGKGGGLNGFQMQNPKRDLDYLPVGIRECFTARPGMLFYDNDFSSLELCTVAQVCMDLLGWSTLGIALNAGKDVHLVMAANMMGWSYEETVHRKHEPEVKKARQLSKVANFGYWGGLGAEGFAGFARGYGVKIAPDKSKELKAIWLATWPEANEYFRWIRDHLALDNGKEMREALLQLGDEIDEEQLERYTFKIPTGVFQQLRVGRFRGRCKFTVGCNTMFQGLGADGSKQALWDVTRNSYDITRGSVLYGSRPVIFVHDEIVGEAFEEIAHEQAFEAAEVMVKGCNRYLPDVPVRCAPALGKHWSKELEGVFDVNGRLQPYDIAKARKQKVFYADGQPVKWAA